MTPVTPAMPPGQWSTLSADAPEFVPAEVGGVHQPGEGHKGHLLPKVHLLPETAPSPAQTPAGYEGKRPGTAF